MKKNIVMVLVVFLLSLAAASVSHAALLASGDFGPDTWNQTISTYYVSDPDSLVLDDWAMAVGVSFMSASLSTVYYPDDPVYYPDFPGLELPLTDGASVRMEFEDLVGFITDNGYTLRDPPYLKIEGGLFPINTSYYTTSVPRMNHGCNIYSTIIDFDEFDGSQVVDGYLIDYIEWTIGNPTYLGHSEILYSEYIGNYYAYSVSFDNLTFKIYGDPVSSPVPVPPAIFLLGSGLLGLISIKTRKKKS